MRLSRAARPAPRLPARAPPPPPAARRFRAEHPSPGRTLRVRSTSPPLFGGGEGYLGGLSECASLVRLRARWGDGSAARREGTMQRGRMSSGALAWQAVLVMLGLGVGALLAPAGATRAATYPAMAPVSAYMMERDAEVAM